MHLFHIIDPPIQDKHHTAHPLCLFLAFGKKASKQIHAELSTHEIN